MPSTQPSQSINFVLSVHMRSSPPLTLLNNHKLDHVFGEKERKKEKKKGRKKKGNQKYWALPGIEPGPPVPETGILPLN